jgi:hypothetical protein
MTSHNILMSKFVRIAIESLKVNIARFRQFPKPLSKSLVSRMAPGTSIADGEKTIELDTSNPRCHKKSSADGRWIFMDLRSKTGAFRPIIRCYATAKYGSDISKCR